MSTYSSIALAGILLMCCTKWGSATDHTVGGSTGWANGVDYSTWTSGKTFAVGDNLVFNYAGGAHSVSEVSAGDYKACSTSNSISSDSSGATTIPLKTAGAHYFICGIPGHCSGGMKLSVSVSGPSSSSPGSTTPSSTTPSTAAAHPKGAAGSLAPASAAVIGAAVVLVKLGMW
ncbi:putative blue copper protein [Iris pallida]|uniref:Blue copper protein n=1 Tax=Iris pallida TaxID=29817 RepID=A0AAX6HQN0_IRIPA|nr:putative blue copper protein [Iris pallida]